MFMKKISSEEKIEVVERYLSGRVSINAAAELIGVHWQTVDEWVRLYRMRGIDGLIPTEKNRKYPPEVKCEAVRAYLDGMGSLRDICIKFGISSNGMLRRWIARYNSHGEFKQPDMEPDSRENIYMAKGRATTLEERIEMVSYCIANSKNYGKTVNQYGVSYQQIYSWVRKYEKDGIDGLADRRGHRRDKSSMDEVEKLHAQLKLKDAENRRLQMENDLLKKLEALERGRGEN